MPTAAGVYCIWIWSFVCGCCLRLRFKVTLDLKSLKHAEQFRVKPSYMTWLKCSDMSIFLLRDVRQMLLKLVELRSSDWGRVRVAAAASNATPDNDPNYFMVSVILSIPPICLFFFKFYNVYSVCICLSWICFSPLRMNLHSTQKMGLLLQQQTQVRLCQHVHDRSGEIFSCFNLD